MMKRNVLWVGLVALVLCFSVAFLTGCSKKAGLMSEEVVTQEQKPAAKAPAAAAPAPAPAPAARERTAPEQSLQDKTAKPAADKPAADKPAIDKAAADKAAKDKAAADKAAADKAAKAAAAILEELQIQDIRFDFDKYNLTNAASLVLRLKAPAYLKYKDYKLVVEGHCDERGTVEYNLALGQKRADEAAKYLADLGVQKDRIKTISYGEEMPLDKGHDEDAWMKNRRAHFVIFPPVKK